MFFTYLRRELRRRIRQAIFIALGLAVGIGLVITVTAASDGVKNSQATVLHSLYGVGTDVTITQPPAQNVSRATTFGFKQDIQAVRDGTIAPGSAININNLVNSEFGTIQSTMVDSVKTKPHVSGAVGGLTLNDVTVTGTVPSISLVKGQGGSFSSNFTTNSYSVSGVDVSNVNLGALAGAKVTSGSMLTAAEANDDDAVIESNYASQNNLKVNSTVQAGATKFKVVGIVTVPGSTASNIYIPLGKAQAVGKTGGSLLTKQVNTIYVSADSAANIPTVQKELTTLLPHSTVTDENDLASQVSGSLSSASSLANNLGKWLSIAVLIAAFLLASLLTMAAVARRVREFGTLKALGWRSRRIVLQVMGESLVIGIVGGAAGVGLGYAGATVIDRLAPKLSATVGSAAAAPSSGGGVAAGLFKNIPSATHTISVTLSAPVSVDVIGLAVVLAIAGGLIAGLFGSWRAARLRPAAALARVE